MEEIINQFLSLGGRKSRRFLDVSVKVSSAVQNVSDDVIECWDKFSKWLTQQAWRLSKHGLLRLSLLSLYQVVQLQSAGLQEKGSFSSQWFKAKIREKIENVSLESCSQIFEETRRIQDPVQFTGRKKKKKLNNK